MRKRRREGERLEDGILLALKVEKARGHGQECRWHLDAGKGKKMDLPLDFPGVKLKVEHLDFRTSDL